MTDHHESLSPPGRTHLEDPGAHDLDSDSEDHFSDAQSVPAASSRNSPVPRTRVEKVSDEPSYGEVPGTEAYQKREGDAAPDEIAVIPDNDSDSAGAESPSAKSTSSTAPPGGNPIPTTVVEETADGDGARTPDGKKHASDPLPDLVVKADGTLEGGTSANVDASISSPTAEGSPAVNTASGDGSGDGSGDDFDDFEADGGGGDDDDDFGDFDDGFEAPAPEAIRPPPSNSIKSTPQGQPQPQPPQQPPPALSFPIPDFDGLDADAFLQTVTPYLNGLYFDQSETSPSPSPPLPATGNPLFLTPRSASLWSQLVAPPPLQPPDWIRSRIRRLFLVSLGVPVDLDEILPASKQKKLVLPSLSVRLQPSPRTSTDSRRSARDGSGAAAAKHSVARLKQSGANGSSSSVDSAAAAAAAASSARSVGNSGGGSGAGTSSRKRRGPPPAPDFDLVTARQLCMTTDEALGGMTDAELQAHVERLVALEGTAKEALEYWTKRTDEKIGERETFEGVIENLVAHARKTRK